MASRGSDGRGRGRATRVFRGQARGGRGSLRSEGYENQFGNRRGGGRGNSAGPLRGSRGRGRGCGSARGAHVSVDAAAAELSEFHISDNISNQSAAAGRNQPRQTFPLGFPKIDELLEKSPHDALQGIAAGDAFKVRLNCGNYKNKFTELCPILRLIRKSLECNQTAFGATVSHVISQLVESDFLKSHLPAQVMQYPQLHANRAKKAATEENFCSVLHVMHEILQRKPDDQKMLSGLYGVVTIAFGQFQSAKAQFISKDQSEVASAFARVKARWDDLTTTAQARLPPPKMVAATSRAQLEQPPPSDFRTMSCFPTRDDFDDPYPYLRPNKTDGSYSDANHYLDVQFRLLREDFIGPIRDGVLAYKAAQADGNRRRLQNDIHIYPETWINPTSSVTFTGAIVHQLLFDPKPFGRLNWDKSKRLIFGFLVGLSQDNFDTILFATVNERKTPKVRKGIILVQFETSLFGGAGQQLWRLNAPFVMVESPVYFEAYRHVLKALQQTSTRNFPMERYLIRCEPNVSPPKYANGVTFSFTSLGTPLKSSYARVNLLRLDEWPSAAELQLDESQYAALQLALTKELALIQGPPGTGKTFIGYKIAQFLLSNRASWCPVTHYRVVRYGRRRPGFGFDSNDDKNETITYEEGSPILVICYTNHALDQFLEGILQFQSDGIIRVGGRCQNPALEGCMLKNVVYAARDEVPKDQRKAYWNVSQIVKFGKRRLERQSQLLAVSQSQLISVGSLQDCMDEAARKAFGGVGTRLEDWLFKDSAALGRLQEHAARISLATVNNVDDDVEYDDEEECDAAEEEQRRLENENDDADIFGEEVFSGFELNDPEMNDMEEGEWFTAGGQNNSFASQHADLIRRLVQDESAMSPEEASLAGGGNVWALPFDQRWRLYRYWLRRYREGLTAKLSEMQTTYVQDLRRLQEMREMTRLKVLKRAKVIGMTTTGAARLQGLLQEIKPKIVIIEEAAEVLEAHIVAGLTISCQHLILIGDHHQLRPSTAVYELAIKYKLEISLFERLVMNKFDRACLKYQHRMRAEIASTLMPHFYDALESHADVFRYPHVKGVNASMFFIDHREKEQGEKDSKSKKNPFEAKFVVGLAHFLLQQGYAPNEITILSAYMGQVLLIRNELKSSNNDLLKSVKVFAVDNFQGEENQIILLSLVRSNNIGKIGFLNIKNRICVALSRAKLGFYCIGNFKQMQACSVSGGQTPWRQICESLAKVFAIGPALTVACQRHNTAARIERAADFQTYVPDGGCKLACDGHLDCGHPCKRFCHSDDPLHVLCKCTEVCGRKCAAGEHNCKKICFKCSDNDGDCGPCKVAVTKLLACGHAKLDCCHLKPQEVRCEQPCYEELACGHQCQAFCSTPHTTECRVLVDKMRSCGHIARVACSALPEESLCSVKVEKLWPACGHRSQVECQIDVRQTACSKPCRVELACKHRCPGTCGTCRSGRLHQRCREPCARLLVCGHRCKEMCSVACPPCKAKFVNRCNHSICAPRSCGESCPQCMADCAWKCEHAVCEQRCHEPCAREPCNLPCNKKLPCKHECLGLCGEPCPRLCDICTPGRFKAILALSGKSEFDRDAMRLIQLQDCSHVFLVSDMDAWMSSKPNVGGSGASNDAAAEAQSEEFSLKSCMLCRAPIRRSYRYGQQIKQSLMNVEKIKAKIRGGLSKAQVLAALAEIDAKWSEAHPKRDKGPNWHDWSSTKTALSEMLEKTRDCDATRDRLDTVASMAMFLARLAELSDYFELRLQAEFKINSEHISSSRLSLDLPNLNSAIQLWLRKFTSVNTNPSSHSLAFADVANCYLQAEFRFCFQWLKDNVKRCSEQMLLEFECELRRFEFLLMIISLFAHMILRSIDPSLNDTAKFKYVLLPQLYGSEPVTSKLGDSLTAQLKQLQARYGVRIESLKPLTERGRMTVFKAVAFSAACWFKCPEGHVYAIGEHGGTMERSVCPECKNDVGGTHRALDSTTQHAETALKQSVQKSDRCLLQ